MTRDKRQYRRKISILKARGKFNQATKGVKVNDYFVKQAIWALKELDRYEGVNSNAYQ